MPHESGAHHPTTTRPEHWIFHRGALGDSILLWPFLRSLVSGGARVVFATDLSKGSLASRELGVIAVNAEDRRFAGLWRHDHTVPEREINQDAVRVTVFSSAGAGSAVWLANARAMFPFARFDLVNQNLDRSVALALAMKSEEEYAASVPPSGAAEGPIVLHVGAGAREKWWPMTRWAVLKSSLESGPVAVCVIAGEVEREKMTDPERACFDRMGGRFTDDLESLAIVIKHARVYVGADSGPTHLAAALGVPTIALFGPTDPARWAPIGPRVRVIAPERTGQSMTWLPPQRVFDAVRAATRRP